jgi:hypothetical protein
VEEVCWDALMDSPGSVRSAQAFTLEAAEGALHGGLELVNLTSDPGRVLLREVLHDPVCTLMSSHWKRKPSHAIRYPKNTSITEDKLDGANNS